MRPFSNRRSQLAALLILASSTVYAKKNWEAAGRRWWAHVEVLANDNMEGRGTGSTGFDLAAEYVSQEFQKAGLRPGGVDNYFQPVKLTQLTLDEASSSLQLANGSKTIDVQLGEDAILGVWPDTAARLEAPLVFVGYGLKIPEAGWDDLGTQHLQGAIAVYLRGGPSKIDGNLRSHYSSNGERWKALKAAGAVGMISISNPKEVEVPWARATKTRLIPKMVLSDATIEDTSGLAFSATWNPGRAQVLFEGSPKTFSQIVGMANGNQPLPHFSLAWKANATTVFKKEPIVSKNVVGIRWGTDAQLSHQFVALSAHLDHLGVGAIGEADRIYNGAMDDASGIASLIEIARELQRKKVQTKRSLIFLAVTAEEKGELGSQYYAAHPSVEGKYVADINMDMFLPLFPLKYLEVQGLNESTLGDDIRAVCESAGVTVQADKEPNKNRFIRSDQYSFIKKGVPALAFKFGYVPGTPEEKTFQSWYTERYHGVKDDLSQPVDAGAAAQFDDILAQLSERVADAAEKPAWKPDSFFRRFAGQSSSSGGI